MKALAQETGARAFFPTQIGELSGVYASIAQELATQYAIGYASKNPKADGALSSGRSCASPTSRGFGLARARDTRLHARSARRRRRRPIDARRI